MHVLEGPRYNMYANEMKQYKRKSESVRKHKRSKSTSRRQQGFTSPNAHQMQREA